jgi:hypothetical protein
MYWRPTVSAIEAKTRIRRLPHNQKTGRPGEVLVSPEASIKEPRGEFRHVIIGRKAIDRFRPLCIFGNYHRFQLNPQETEA